MREVDTDLSHTEFKSFKHMPKQTQAEEFRVKLQALLAEYPTVRLNVNHDIQIVEVADALKAPETNDETKPE